MKDGLSTFKVRSEELNQYNHFSKHIYSIACGEPDFNLNSHLQKKNKNYSGVDCEPDPPKLHLKIQTLHPQQVLAQCGFISQNLQGSCKSSTNLSQSRNGNSRNLYLASKTHNHRYKKVYTVLPIQDKQSHLMKEGPSNIRENGTRQVSPDKRYYNAGGPMNIL